MAVPFQVDFSTTTTLLRATYFHNLLIFIKYLGERSNSLLFGYGPLEITWSLCYLFAFAALHPDSTKLFNFQFVSTSKTANARTLKQLTLFFENTAGSTTGILLLYPLPTPLFRNIRVKAFRESRDGSRADFRKRRNSLGGFYAGTRPRATAQSIELSISWLVGSPDKAN